jgi:hypothetical protein
MRFSRMRMTPHQSGIICMADSMCRSSATNPDAVEHTRVGRLLPREASECVLGCLDLPPDQLAVHGRHIDSGLGLANSQLMNHQSRAWVGVAGRDSRLDGGTDTRFEHRRILHRQRQVG